MDVDAVRELSPDHVLVATGASWRRDGSGRYSQLPLAIAADMPMLTPDDIMAGKRPAAGPVVIFDDDHFYMGGVLAELLRKEGHAVTLVTPAPLVSAYTTATLEQSRVHKRMLSLDVELLTSRALETAGAGSARLACAHGGAPIDIACGSLVLVTARNPDDSLFHALREAGVPVSRAGDCYGPSTIAAATHAGRRFAEEFGEKALDFTDLPYRREVTELAKL